MENIEDVHCMAAIEAVLNANRELMDATVREIVSEVHYGKPDTLGLDAIPEKTIELSLRKFDADAILITEEIGATGARFSALNVTSNRPTFYISDPTDRSTPFHNFLLDEDKIKKVGDLMNIHGSLDRWSGRFGAPPSITGASSAITCVRYGVPIASAIVNFITQELFVASRQGVFCMDIQKDLDPAALTFDKIRSSGRPVFFPGFSGPPREERQFFTTFLGKKGYLENFRDFKLWHDDEWKQFCKHSEPGGPTRPLYLSDIQPDSQIGFILANGEKISEWIHWIPFVRFGRTSSSTIDTALVMYELSQDRPWTKEGILMSTSPIYSIFKPVEESKGNIVINVEKLVSITNPSEYRATLLVTHATNYWANITMANKKFPRISFVPRQNEV